MAAHEKTTAIVLAAGRGRRMQSDTPKQYLTLKGKPLLFYALDVFQKSFVDEIVLVTGEDEIETCRSRIVEPYGFTKVKKIIAGGAERYHSVARGLEAIEDGGYVFIHDGARPFIKEEILERAYQAAVQYGACAVGMPVKDTIKIADDECFSVQTPDRETLWQMQTPQVFETALARRAYGLLMEQEKALMDAGVHITDDAMVVETLLHQKVKLVEGAYSNFKITTPEEIKMAAGHRA